MAARGRPHLTDEQAGAEAAKIIEVAHRLRYRPGSLAELGHTEASAWKLAGKRYRGKVGALLGDTVREMLFPAKNRVARAAQLVTEHGVPVPLAVVPPPTATREENEVDPRNLRRRVKVWREDMERKNARVLAMRTQIDPAN